VSQYSFTVASIWSKVNHRVMLRRSPRRHASTILALNSGVNARCLEECAVFTVKYGLTIKNGGCLLGDQLKPIARQAD
jgi:hypothetical protein